jgi:hypothetical protein
VVPELVSFLFSFIPYILLFTHLFAAGLAGPLNGHLPSLLLTRLPNIVFSLSGISTQFNEFVALFAPIKMAGLIESVLPTRGGENVAISIVLYAGVAILAGCLLFDRLWYRHSLKLNGSLIIVAMVSRVIDAMIELS